jgi:hypothetical protein
MRVPVPLTKRPIDLLFVIFFAINLGFITYIVDLEQLTVADPNAGQYPIWPPAPLVDLVHWWGRTYDPPLMAREPWWRATIWIDALFFGPFYAVAIYAFTKAKEWIRIPCFMWASVMMTNVTVILFEEMLGPHKTPRPGMILFANAAWFLLPILMIVRMARSPHPFTVAKAEPAAAPLKEAA